LQCGFSDTHPLLTDILITVSILIAIIRDKPTSFVSTNLPTAPLYLQALMCYTNVLLLSILLIVTVVYFDYVQRSCSSLYHLLRFTNCPTYITLLLLLLLLIFCTLGSIDPKG